MATNKRELSATIPSTTTLKLFSYPHKYGGSTPIPSNLTTLW